jgi:hypothetical protein
MISYTRKEFIYVERHHAHTTGALSQGYPPDRIHENSHSILNPRQPVLLANFLLALRIILLSLHKGKFPGGWHAAAVCVCLPACVFAFFA